MRSREGVVLLAVGVLALVGVPGCEEGGGGPAPAAAHAVDLTRWAVVDLTRAAEPGTRMDGPVPGATRLASPAGRAARGADPGPALERLMGPAVVIDVASTLGPGSDATLRPRDVQAWERSHGRVPAGGIVLLRFGREADAPVDRGLPLLSPDAVRLLVEGRRASVLGTDAAWPDPAPDDRGPGNAPGPATIASAGAPVPVLERLWLPEELPAVGATVIALPAKVEGATRVAVRVVALVPRD